MKDLTDQEKQFLEAYRAADYSKKKQVEDILFPKKYVLVTETVKQEPKQYVLVRVGEEKNDG